MQDTSPRLKGTKAIELPVISRFNMRASKEISREGAFLLLFQRPEIIKTCSKVKIVEIVCGAQALFISRGAGLVSTGSVEKKGSPFPLPLI